MLYDEKTALLQVQEQERIKKFSVYRGMTRGSGAKPPAGFTVEPPVKGSGRTGEAPPPLRKLASLFT